MYAVGRIGSYITRGVYTVSGPFHPFGGAVDIVVVEQPDGSFKSSPWYVRFGKFQGVLKAREKVVNICVNGVESNIHMYLDERGEAYFLEEEEEEDGESVLSHSLSGDETDGQSSGDETGGQSKKNVGPRKSKGCNDNDNEAAVGDRTDAKNGKVLSPADSPRRSRSMGFFFGLRSVKQDCSLEESAVTGMARTISLDGAEIAPKRRYDALDGQGDDHMLPNDEESKAQSPTHYSVKNNTDIRVVVEESGSCNVENDDSSNSSFVSLDTVDGTDVEMLNLWTAELPVETSGIGKIVLEGKFEGPSEISTIIDEPCLQNDNLVRKIDSVIAEVSNSDSEIPIVLGAQACKRVYKEQKSGERVVALPGNFVSDEASQSENFQYFVCSETSEISAEQTPETMYVASGESMQVQLCADTLHATAKPLSEGNDPESKNIMNERDHIEICRSSSQQTNPSCCVHVCDEVKLEGPVKTSESCTCVVSVDSLPTSAAYVDLKSSCSIPNFNHKGHQIEEENNIMDEVIRNELQPSLDIGGHPEQNHDGHGSIEATNISVSESSEEEQFHFSDVDDFEPSELQCESKFEDGVDKDRHPSAYLEGSKETYEPFETKDECYLFPEQLVEENQNPTINNLKESSSIMSSPVGIPKARSLDTEIARTAESLPMWSRIENLDSDEVRRPLSHSLDLESKSMEWTFHIKDGAHSMNLDAAIETQPARNHLNSEDMYKPEDLEYFGSNPAAGDPSEITVASSGRWKLWPFSFRRARSENSVEPAPDDIISSDVENASDNNIDMDTSKHMLKSKVTENRIRAKTPTSEQLASLNLMEGKNVVTFTFSTTVLGEQQVDARIFCWKWDTRIVISDVDGTITRSDVLGQFMPLVGVDWSQTGVAPLFSAIKENGYQLLFLSARSISQAYITRQFLINLKQDGKALPEGPVVISPDGLFPSLYREVIRRAPHEFKIACLEDIRVLFPPDCNPFYAGFGNRDTDEISYLKVGIPKGKIFIINPKGEVAVHRRVDTKSYTSLHALVHDMFPPSQSFEQEDFNSWNFWKLAPPLIDS